MTGEVKRYRDRIGELGWTGEGQRWFEGEDVKGTITPEEFERRMRLIHEVYGGEPNDTHIAQDKLMLEALRQNGYGEGAAVYCQSTKWYA